MASSAEPSNEDHAVELIVCDASASADGGTSACEEIAPLLTQAMRPKINIFSVSYSRRKPRAILLSFTTPIMASIVARIMLHEKLKFSDVGGLACSFFGVLFIFQQILTPQGGLFTNVVATNANFKGSHHILAALVGLFSAIAGCPNYCPFKGGAKASDQPIATVFSFSILATPAAGLCTLTIEEFILPGIYSVFLMVELGILAFLAEVLVARGLQLEKTSKVANVLYIEAALAQLWHIGSSSVAPAFGQLVGCLLIVISVCCTMYIGPDKDVE